MAHRRFYVYSCLNSHVDLTVLHLLACLIYTHSFPHASGFNTFVTASFISTSSMRVKQAKFRGPAFQARRALTKKLAQGQARQRTFEEEQAIRHDADLPPYQAGEEVQNPTAVAASDSAESDTASSSNPTSSLRVKRAKIRGNLASFKARRALTKTLAQRQARQTLHGETPSTEETLSNQNFQQLLEDSAYQE